MRLALIELEIRPSRACLSYAPAGNSESARHRIVASSGRPHQHACRRASLIAALLHAC